MQRPCRPAAIGSTKLELTDQPTNADLAAIFNPLADVTAQVAGPAQHRPLAVLIRDDAGDTIGGLWGHTVYSWLIISLLFVPDDLRRRGVGTALIERAEQAATERGCIGAQVDAYDFQAAGFYERRGYRVFAALPDHPPGHRRLFFHKPLAQIP